MCQECNIGAIGDRRAIQRNPGVSINWESGDIWGYLKVSLIGDETRSRMRVWTLEGILKTKFRRGIIKWQPITLLYQNLTLLHVYRALYSSGTLTVVWKFSKCTQRETKMVNNTSSIFGGVLMILTLPISGRTSSLLTKERRKFTFIEPDQLVP